MYWLVRRCRDGLKVIVDVQHGELYQVCCGGDPQVGNRRRPMLTSSGQGK